MVSETINYEAFFEGGYSSLSPEYGNFVGYRLSGAQLGSPTGIQTANQLNEVVARIKEGVKNVELQPLQQGVFDQIPKQHFAEMRALMKLTGVKPSVHAEIIDPAGFGERGYEGEHARQDAERKLMSIVEKAHELDPEGNTPLVIHSTGGVPGAEYRPGDVKKGEDRFKERKLILMNRESKQLVPVEEEYKYYPLSSEEELKGKGILHTPRDDIHSLNATEWDQKLTNLAFYKKHADEIMAGAPHVLAEFKEAPAVKQVIDEINKNAAKQEAYKKLTNASVFLDNVRLNFNSAFNMAYKYGNEEQKEALRNLAKEYQNEFKEYRGKVWQPVEQSKLFDKSIAKLAEITGQAEGIDPRARNPNFKAPEVYMPVEDFAMGEAAKTFGNLAFKSYNKYGDNSPIIAVENMYQGMAFSRAEDLKKLIGKSKKVFIENAKKSKSEGGLGMSNSTAEKKVDKILGVTWDVGHLNMMRKSGFEVEDIIKETEKIGKLVKHVHLTDNFGYSDSHLPPGMGNVPTKAILEKLEKAGALKNARAIVEAGPFAATFKKSPFPITLQAMGSSIYGAKMAPYWDQSTAGAMGNYFGFPMAYLPEKHFSMYGSGFSMLPEELGGQVPGTQSRFSGTANA